MYLHTFDTAYGPIGLAWSQIEGIIKISRIFLPRNNLATIDYAIQESSCKEIKQLAKKIDSALNGKKIVFSLDTLNLNILSPFQKKILIEVVYKIERGSLMSYSGVALEGKIKNGGRAVGRVMAANPFPIIIPCHRVIRSDGSIGGYFGGEDMKLSLLRIEGIPINNKCLVDRG